MLSLNDVPIAVLVTSIEGAIKHCNDEFKRILELNHDIPKTITEILPKPSILFLNSYIYPMMLKSGRLDEVYCKFSTRTKKELPVLLNIDQTIVNDEACYIWVLYRAEERQKFQAELIESRNRLSANEKLIKQRNYDLEIAESSLRDELRLRDRFFSIIAHDLKSPFNGLIGLSEMLLESANENDTDSIIEFSTYILESSRTLYDLTRNLLDWAVLQASHLEINQTEISINQVITENLTVLQNLAEKKAVKIENKITDATIFTDYNMTSFIIRNLLSNAIKFSPENTTISLQSKTDANQILIAMSDQGSGIEKSLIDDLFKIDIKTSTAGTKGEIGTGIGLPVCKQMAQLNKGDITCYNNSDVGATFELTLPLVLAG